YESTSRNAESRYSPLGETGDMLIICHDAWLPNIQSLVAHKNNNMGINTTAVGVSTIGNNSTSIKSYIQNVYNTSDLAFVLLVGDQAQVATPSASGGASDPSYSKLSGSDDYPDILVGRFSAESAGDVDTQVQRTIEYEQMPATQQDWFKKGVGIGSAEGPGHDNEYDYQHIDNIRADLLGYDYTLVDQVYDPGASASQVSAAVNAGRGIINYCGHGSTTSWGTTGFSTTSINALTNDNMLPFIFDVACVNGEFDGPTCFAEAWMRATNGSEPTGAIGIYASSINQSWSPPMDGQDEMNDLLVAEAYFSFGAICYAGSCKMIDMNGSGGVSMFDTWHVFGDPSVRVFGTGAPPTGMAVTPSSALSAEGDSGGPFSPNSITYTIENLNDTGINYSITHTQSWVSVSPASGYLSGHGTVNVTVSINSGANSLNDGTYTDTVQFINTTDNQGDTNRAVTLTVGGPAVQYSWNMDSNPGWSTQGLWAWGQPTGGGGAYGNPDPTSGHTGNNVFGYNLSGDYENSLAETHLTTGALDCTGLAQVTLKFWRWLGVEQPSYDHAYLRVSTNGSTWTTVWQNTAAVEDSGWSLQEYDISSVADGAATVYLRWTIGTTDGSWTYCGWNIDDVEIWAVGGGGVVDPPEINTPAEYEQNEGMFISWGSYTSVLAEMTATVTTGDPDAIVYIAVSGSSEQSSATSTLNSYGADMSQVEFITYNTDTVWVRDYGPRFVMDGTTRTIIDYEYNRPRPNDDAFPTFVGTQWGESVTDSPLEHGGGNLHFMGDEAFMSDLILDENPSYSEQDVKNHINQLHNVDLTIYPRFPASFDSTGHIDMWMIPVDDDEVIIGEYSASTGSPYTITENAVADLTARGYTVYRTPGWNSGGTHYTYTNAVIMNDVVMVPSYGSGNDSVALSVFQTAFPNRDIHMINCSDIIQAAGAIHCVMKHIPVGGNYTPTGNVYSSVDTPLSIPDNNSTGITSEIYINQSVNISELNVYIDITHTDISDLEIVLTSPSTTTALIHDQTGAGTENIEAWYDTEVLPVEPLTVFEGDNALGWWTLTVMDKSNNEVGTLNGWSLEINGQRLDR
ncbi:C25 family cysteine peptidase, partial [candidate division CSSED10-310 bacterium]